MRKLLHLSILLSLLTAPFVTTAHGRTAFSLAAVDDEYDRYKKRGDDYFKEGKYFEARRQYQNCLEVPGFENDAYARGQIEECTTGLNLRKQAEDALRQGKGPEAVALLNQLLNLNPDDVITRAQYADYYEREGNVLFNQKRYLLARESYSKALTYTTTRQETLRLQIRTIDNLTRPSRRVGLKLATGVVAIGAGAYALLLRSDYQSKLDALNQISQTTDPTNSGEIADPAAYQQYSDAYDAAAAAQKKSGLFKACIGVAAVATVAEIYLLLRKPKPRTTALELKPASQSWGLAVSYKF
ncbi:MULTISPECIES: hypothetical protein [Spirosoma]|uniref:Uncharacterized protein n=1 Tax=Spirosoma sordidisoli TaxID=2502893 RepID=A0A4Q2UMY9_9BACT|nr:MULTISPECIES: hypothetical protein [Spirosoma]RYC71013.1 hypothetical protein EQG79_02375 [Spirosoma sordidisoli]